MKNVARTIGLSYASSRHILGENIGIAIMDTGIEGTHPDFHGFHSPLTAFYDCIHQRTVPYDDNGHGTHVAGIICGNGNASNGLIRGIAPCCNIIVVKVLNYRGEGNVEDVLCGVQWILQNRKKYNIRLVNISVGSSREKSFQEESPLVQAVDSLWDAGLIVTTAAGNHGPEKYSIGAPGNSRKIITVGSSDDNRRTLVQGQSVRSYSSRGPTLKCIKKPDIVAPGSNIFSCSHMFRNNYNFGKTSYYTTKSGTSMSTPIVTGSLALLLCVAPHMSNRDVKLHLRSHSIDLGLPHERQGWGLLTIPSLLSDLV